MSIKKTPIIDVNTGKVIRERKENKDLNLKTSYEGTEWYEKGYGGSVSLKGKKLTKTQKKQLRHIWSTEFHPTHWAVINHESYEENRKKFNSFIKWLFKRIETGKDELEMRELEWEIQYRSQQVRDGQVYASATTIGYLKTIYGEDFYD
jgi:hypothetical protein